MLNRTREISNTDDVIDVRDIIARIEILEGDDIDEQIDKLLESDEATELVALRELMGELAGYGGDEQWRGDWYPIMLIRDSYFEDYAQELADDLDLIPRGAKWPATCIDWKQAARELQQDYSSVEFDDITYWYR